MIKRFSFYGFVLLCGVLSSCDNNKSSISPRITILNDGFKDTVKFEQRFKSSLIALFKDDDGLASYHIRINDSIYDPIPLNGNSLKFQLDTAFRNAGLYKFTVFVSNTKGLESTYYIPIRCDSIKPPQIQVNDLFGKVFRTDSSVISGQKLAFTFIVHRGKLPLDSLRFSNTINNEVTTFRLRDSTSLQDTVKITYTSPPIIAETIFSFFAIDNVGLESKTQVKVIVKK